MKPKEKISGKDFVELVFSWTLQDVINQNLLKNKVQEMPKTFPSSFVYLESFVSPLLEETRAELCSNMETISEAPLWNIKKVEEHKDFKPPKNLLYKVVLTQEKDGCPLDQLQYRDLVAITDVKPENIEGINTPSFPYLIAVIISSDEENPGFVTIISSRQIVAGGRSPRKLYAVCLLNINTNLRIWNALHPSKNSMPLVEKVLNEPSIKSQHGEKDEDENNGCPTCSLDASVLSSLLTDIKASKLNSSQEDAIMSCIARSKCNHGLSLKLIWGPPGTGKTKTIAYLLNSLLDQRCRTVTCAPTNKAVIEVATRLRNSVADSSNGRYRMGDIVLFGNEKRMKIDDLQDIFLDHRIKVLQKLLRPTLGWRGTLSSLIHLLENPQECYAMYLANKESLIAVGCKEELDGGRKGKCEKMKSQGSGYVGKAEGSGKNREKEKHKNSLRSPKMDQHKGRVVDPSEGGKQRVIPLTFREFIKQKLKLFGNSLMLYIVQLCTLLPTSALSVEQAKHFMEAREKLKIFLARKNGDAFVAPECGRCSSDAKLLADSKTEVLHCLKQLHLDIKFPRGRPGLQKFYFENACLLFGTASGTDKLRNIKTPIQMLLIDEAGQLKECESTIPLQLPGLRHAVLVGDENQLNAMVSSEINQKAGFGRSLFERLVSLGYKKHLLNVQYRMHPSISSFPNSAFYDNLISDGSNVTDESYQKQFLEGDMFGPYSFINIGHGIEKRDLRSIRNDTEVAVIENIVERLSKVAKTRLKKFSVGIISPYKAQVNSICERLKRFTLSPVGGLSLHVSSVDGFQGGEEDIILFSAVRSNTTGTVGFLSNRPRTNVAITRARHCAWILGDGSTLEKSGSVWADLLKNAKMRRCYHEAGDDKEFSLAISSSLIENDQITLAKSMFLNSSPWKVIFSDDFDISLKEAKKFGVQRKALSLIQKLAFCWRPSEQARLCTRSLTCKMMLKQIRISSQFTLIWSIDIEKEKSHETQVIKVWAIKPFKDVPNLVKKLDTVFGNYLFETLSRCQFQRKDGELVVPMRWRVDEPVDTSSLPDTMAVLSLADG